jgi:hypothetical protein
MQGETNLQRLLKYMQPSVDEREFVICSIDSATLSQLSVKPISFFREAEGITLVLVRKDADKYSLPYSAVWALITLTIHSDLTAIGFLATVTTYLANAGISVNVISGYYHDHLFVQYAERDRALEVLAEISNGL